MKTLRLFIFMSLMSLITAVSLSTSAPAEAATTMGRNFRFTASGSDVLKIVLHETNFFPDGSYAEIIRGDLWALSQSDGQIINGRWTWEGPLNSFSGFPASPGTVEVQLGVYGEVSLNGIKQSTFDNQLVPEVTITNLNQVVTPDRIFYEMTVDVTPKADGRWVTTGFLTSWDNLSSADRAKLNSALIAAREFEFLQSGTNQFNNTLEVDCTGEFLIVPYVKFGPSNVEYGASIPSGCPR